jgi:hypothetical protein
VTVGFQLAKADIDNSVGREIGAVWESLAAINRRNIWLADSSHNLAFTATLGYTTAEDVLLRAAVADLNKLWQISHAAATQGAANDFFFNAKLLGGVNWYG